MFSEQAFLNAGPLIVRGLQGAAAAGFIFNVLMIARAPLQLFQAVSTSILPHLTSLHTSERGRTASASSTARCGWCCSAIAAFTALSPLVVLIAGPKLMQIAFSNKFTYDRAGLLLVTARDGPLPRLGDGQPGLHRPGPGAARRGCAGSPAPRSSSAGTSCRWSANEFRRVEIGFAARRRRPLRPALPGLPPPARTGRGRAGRRARPRSSRRGSRRSTRTSDGR